jgi:uncharacterized membrane protein YccF (DUF307 family)
VRTVLNVIWLLLCGIWLALVYLLASMICCVFIVTIPFGLTSFRIAGLRTLAIWQAAGQTVRRGCALPDRQHSLDRLRRPAAGHRA